MATKTKGVQVSATLAPQLDAWLEDHRWGVRQSKTELVRTAVEQYAARNGYTAPDAGSESETANADG